MPDRYFQIGYSKYITSQLTNYLHNKFRGGSYCVHNSPPLGPIQRPTNPICTVLKPGRTNGRVICYRSSPPQLYLVQSPARLMTMYYMSHTLKIRFCINLPSTPRSSKWSLSFSIYGHIFLCCAYTYHAGYMHRPCHLPSFDHLNNISWRTQFTKFHIMQILPAYWCRFSLVPSILTSTLFWRILNQ
jgi:hypothetical protein